MNDLNAEGVNKNFLEPGGRIVSLIAQRITGELNLRAGRYRETPKDFSYKELLMEVACAYGFHDFAIEYLRKVLDGQDWREKLKTPLPRTDCWHRQKTDFERYDMEYIVKTRLLIAELLMDSGRAAEFACECTAIEKDFNSWDMGGRNSDSLKGELCVLKARCHIRLDRKEKAKELLEETLTLADPHERNGVSRLAAYTLLCTLALQEGNLEVPDAYIDRLAIDSKWGLLLFALPLSLWWQACHALLILKGESEGDLAHKILRSWRENLDCKAKRICECSGLNQVYIAPEESKFCAVNGAVLKGEGRFAEARHSFKKALKLAARAKFVEPLFQARCQAGIAECFDGEQRLACGERRWQQAIALVGDHKSLGDAQLARHIFRSLGNSLLTMKRFGESLAWQREADQLGDEANLQITIIEDWQIGDKSGESPLLFSGSASSSLLRQKASSARQSGPAENSGKA